MLRLLLALLVALLATPALAQEAPQATDVTSADIQAFINALPRDRVSDRPIRVVEVTGDYRVGVYGVFRPKDFRGGARAARTASDRGSYVNGGCLMWSILRSVARRQGTREHVRVIAAPVS